MEIKNTLLTRSLFFNIYPGLRIFSGKYCIWAIIRSLSLSGPYFEGHNSSRGMREYFGKDVHSYSGNDDKETFETGRRTLCFINIYIS